ncbi:CHRD domain-containing protein [Granulicella sp. 5B5]|uniref:CHRD domain-containing protein n=1 Tax=Granulicella sp. 5B5 TaxID=1617967 RepID=UPI0015F596CE|nr:CHRD domain-containing protein [Granulicella sp. 5B5]QMV19751.1 CHRD domain-containing protein [Granulicella sp. 5B5]
MKQLTRIICTAVMTPMFALASVAAHAATIHFKADLQASSEVPAKNSTGTGALTASLDTDTNELTYHIEFRDLTGPVLAAHFHGPAAPGTNAKPQVAIKVKPIVSPIEGKVTLTPEQAKDLEGGQWYFNLHTSANPSGEIRGQILKTE